ncbi:MAG TPA: MFS transporter [Solirubrobacteraceae bacterium]|nr:MFS transporter [Solirubrobacteraceae bacterium]
MYNVQDSSALVAGHRALLRPRTAERRVPRTVVLLGMTSLLTDISSEMVAAVLPLYLVYAAGLSPLALGVVDGLYRGAAAIAALASGFAADRRRRHKEVASLGYGLSAICKLGLVAAGGAVGAIGAIVMLDRVGKGIRTAPRDALISLSATPQTLGMAFGVHRAMDTTGAMLGPLIAFGILALAPLAFSSVFLVSFCVAVAGLAVIVLLVPRHAARASTGPGPSLRVAAGLLVAPRFRALVVAASLLGVATISDAFLYLALQRHLALSPMTFPLLFVGTSVAYMLLAVPVGRLADRIGRGRVLLGGYALLLPVYASLLAPAAGLPALALGLALVGASYAATDGVLAALASSTLDEDVRGSGLAVLTTATNLARFLASVGFGALWTFAGLDAAVLTCGIALVAAILVTGIVLRATREAPAHA